MKKDVLSKVTVILRGHAYNEVKAVAQAMEGTSFHSMEITTNSPDMLKTLRSISEEFPDLAIGAGTVLSFDQAVKVIDAGAKFVLSPIMLDEKTIRYCKEHGVISVPAAMTPSEVYELFSRGCDVVKVFPAAVVGARFFKDIQSPLGSLELMAVGGVNVLNAKSFLEKGCRYLGVGSGMFRKEDISNCNVKRLRESLAAFENALEA